MANSITIPDQASLLTKFQPTEAAIAKLAEEYMPLTIAGVEDTAGFEVVHSARMDIKARRVAVEKVRKEEKAVALEYGRTVDGIAKRITSLLEPIETHLEDEEGRYNAAKEAIRNAARLKAEAEAKAIADAEAARLKAEHDAEVERLRKEREALDAERARQQAEQERLAAERRAVEAEAKRLADIEAARLRKIEEERIASEAAERARIETEQRLAREASENAAREKRLAEEAEAARLRAEALRPDREKLLSVADKIESIVIPEVSPAAREAYHQIAKVLADAAADIGYIVKTKLGGNGHA